MKKIILDLAVTLDGFIEGPNGETDWCIMDGDGTAFDDFLAGIDTIFYGRVSYDLWGNWQPDEKAGKVVQRVYQEIHLKTKYVFSTTKRYYTEKVIVIDSDIRERVDEIRKQDGKDIWLYGGADLITTFLNFGLIDVIRLAVHPIILGAGKPLFKDIRDRLPLRFTGSESTPSGVIMLTYEMMPK
jgi:dihydrofolate reductase